MAGLTTPGVAPEKVSERYSSLAPEAQEAIIGRRTNEVAMVEVRDVVQDYEDSLLEKVAAYQSQGLLVPQHLIDLAAAAGITIPGQDEPEQLPASDDPIESLTARELRALCVERGLEDHGTKGELIARLAAGSEPPQGS